MVIIIILWVQQWHCHTLDTELALEELMDCEDERLLEDWLEELTERRLLELLRIRFDVLLMGSVTSTVLLLRREDQLLDLELRERELLELEELVAFRPGIRIFLSFIITVLSWRISSSSLTLITLMIFSAALSPNWISISALSMMGPAAASKWIDTLLLSSIDKISFISKLLSFISLASRNLNWDCMFSNNGIKWGISDEGSIARFNLSAHLDSKGFNCST